MYIHDHLQTFMSPTGKDWAKIHKRQWDKMDSIDDYLAKKRKRTESVTQSVKKLKLMTEQMRANLSSIKKPKTPVSHKKQSSVKKQVIGTSYKFLEWWGSSGFFDSVLIWAF